MKPRAKKNSTEMTFLDHLDELRGALWRALGGIVAAALACYYFAPTLQSWLLIPFHNQSSATLALLAPTEGFIVQLEIALVAGLFLSAPWVFLQLWLFVAPGLFQHERRMVLPVVFFSSLLFLTGAAASLFMLPFATRFFLGFANQEVQNVWSLAKYVDFVLRLILAAGLVFELPLIIYFLARFGIVTPAFLRKYRRHMIIAILVLAAILTPPDVFTQMILALPMVLLYEVSILLAVVARKQYDRRHAEFMSDGGNAAESSGTAEPDSAGGNQVAAGSGSTGAEEPASPAEVPIMEAGETVAREPGQTAADIQGSRVSGDAAPDDNPPSESSGLENSQEKEE